MLLVLLSLAACLPLAWLAGRTSWRRVRAPTLPPARQPSDREVAVTVLLPVRDEQANVAECLAALVELSPAARLLVIDDASSDATREIVATLARHEPRIELLDAPALPPGWRGKVNALRRGFEEVRTPWTLLVDADGRPAPESLARALAHAERLALDGVSLASRQDSGTLGEDLVVPAVFGVLDCLLGDWHAAASGGPCIASGQFLLFRSESLRAAGGFETIREATIDDVALFATLRRSGGRTGFVRAPDLLRVRMYTGFGATVTGWRRNFAAILGGDRKRTAAVCATLLAPVAALLALVAAPASGAAASAAAVAAYALGTAASLANRTSGGQRRITAVLWPIECSLAAATILLARRDRRRGRLTSWKGRTIEL